MDELDEIRKDARTAQMLREGVPGQDAGKQELARRLGAPDPEMGAKLRAQPPQDMTELRNRLTASPTATTAAPAVPPRNVPLGTPGGSVPPPNVISVNSAGQAGVVNNPNINPNVRGGMSPEAEAFLKERAATPGSSGVKPAGVAAAAEAAPAAAAEAAPAAARTISSVARRAGPVGMAVGGVMDGADVLRVAQDPNKTKMDVATQAGESGAKFAGTVAGAALGAQGGAALGAMTGPAAPVAVPVLGVAGGIAGGIVGREGVERGIAALRGMFGLDPKPPVATAQTQYERDRQPTTAAAAPAKPAAQQTAAPVQQVSTGVQQPAKTIAGVGQSAAAAPATRTPQVDYRLGENAVEVIQGGDRHVQLFGPNGATATVPKNVFDGGPGAIARYADEVRDAQSRAMTDPDNKLAQTRLQNEGRESVQRIANEGHVQGIREQAKAPVAIKGPMGNTESVYQPGAGGAPGQFVQPPVNLPKPATAQKAHAYVKEALEKGWTTPEAANQQLSKWGYPSLSLNSK